jgi:hypothetical protein
VKWALAGQSEISVKEQAYCIFCKSKKYVYTKKHANFVNWVLSIFCAIFIGFIVFGDIDFKSVIFLGVLIAIAEIFIHLRWRMSLICHECGFDPIIYLKDPEAAAQIVKKKLHDRSNNPANYLKPPLKVPIKIISDFKSERIVSIDNLTPQQKKLLRLSFVQKQHADPKRNQESNQRDAMTPSNIS